jgi:hypothetical protein
LLGGSSRGGSVTIIETSVARSYRRRALIAFFVSVAVVGLLAGTVASDYMHPILGGIVGILLGVVTGAVVGLFIVAWPVLRVLWHWAPEILLALGCVYGWTWLMRNTGMLVSLLVVVLVVGVPAAVGPVRRRIVALAWCVIVRHRLRLCFAAFIATNRQGTLPLILTARPTPAGERVWIWLRPGLSLKDLEAEGQMAKLAVACWANEVRVCREGRRWAALIRVDITRREPLARTVPSPLPDTVPDTVPTNAPTSPGMPPVGGLDLDQVPEDPDGLSVKPSSRKPRSPAAPTGAPPPEFDNSDYA